MGDCPNFSVHNYAAMAGDFLEFCRCFLPTVRRFNRRYESVTFAGDCFDERRMLGGVQPIIIRDQAMPLGLLRQAHAAQQSGKPGVTAEIFERRSDLQKDDSHVAFGVSLIEPLEGAVLVANKCVERSNDG